MTDSPAVLGFWITMELYNGPVKNAKPSQRETRALHAQEIDIGLRNRRRVGFVQLINTEANTTFVSSSRNGLHFSPDSPL